MVFPVSLDLVGRDSGELLLLGEEVDIEMLCAKAFPVVVGILDFVFTEIILRR